MRHDDKAGSGGGLNRAFNEAPALPLASQSFGHLGVDQHKSLTVAPVDQQAPFPIVASLEAVLGGVVNNRHRAARNGHGPILAENVSKKARWRLVRSWSVGLPYSSPSAS